MVQLSVNVSVCKPQGIVTEHGDFEITTYAINGALARVCKHKKDPTMIFREIKRAGFGEFVPVTVYVFNAWVEAAQAGFWQGVTDTKAAVFQAQKEAEEKEAAKKQAEDLLKKADEEARQREAKLQEPKETSNLKIYPLLSPYEARQLIGKVITAVVQKTTGGITTQDLVLAPAKQETKQAFANPIATIDHKTSQLQEGVPILGKVVELGSLLSKWELVFLTILNGRLARPNCEKTWDDLFGIAKYGTNETMKIFDQQTKEGK